MNDGKIGMEKLDNALKLNAEWLGKYKSIVDGLLTIADVKAETSNHDIEEWGAVYHGLSVISQWIGEDIETCYETMAKGNEVAK